jgi:hypothetical protein
LDTIGPLPNTSSRNKYIIVAIEHYSKCREAKRVFDRIGVIVMKFLVGEIIYHYGVPNCVLIDNGGEWVVEFDNVCKYVTSFTNNI